MKLSLFSIYAHALILSFSFLQCTNKTYAQSANSPSLVAQRSLGSSGADEFRGMQLTSDGGCILAGYSSVDNGDVVTHLGLKDFWVVKLDSTFGIQWQQVLGGSGEDWARDIQSTSDGGYVALGYSNSSDGYMQDNHGSFDFWIVKLDHQGGLLWQKSIGGSKEDNGYTVHQTADGGYICSGYSFSSDGDVTGNHGLDDGWVVKLDVAHNIQWQRSLGGSLSDQIDDVILTTDGGYLLVGYTASSDGDITSNHGGFDLWVIKLNDNGTLMWEKTYGGTNSDAGREGILTPDGGYIIAGISQSINGDVTANQGKSDYWIIKIDANGILQWQRSMGSSLEDYAYNIEASLDGNYLVTGHSGNSDGDAIGNHGDLDAWTVEIDPDGNLLWQKNLGGSMEDVARSCGQQPDGSVLVAGYTRSSDGDVSGQHGGYDGWIGKICFTNDFYADNDLDGYGNDLMHVIACSAPPGYVSDNTDCNDDDSSLHPGATDICDGIDNNCNGQTDENAFTPVISASGAVAFCYPGAVMLIGSPSGTGFGFTWYKDGLLQSGGTGSSYTATTTGSYSAVVTNGLCTNSTNSIQVTSYQQPVVAISPAGITSVCRGTVITLTASVNGTCIYQWYKDNELKSGMTTASYTTNTAEGGAYKVEATDIQGCSAFSPTTIVNRINPPAATITPLGNLDICPIGSVKLQANTGTNLIYQWSKDAVVISGATKKMHIATIVGSYTVKVTNNTGCSKISNGTTVYTSCKLKDQQSNNALASEMTLHPNPTNSQFEIDIKFPDEINTRAVMQVMNVLGQVVYNEIIPVVHGILIKKIQLNDAEANGIYLVRMIVNEEVYSAQIVYQK